MSGIIETEIEVLEIINESKENNVTDGDIPDVCMWDG
jgi:hypothetical protein